jgi:hypothetical protein
VSKLLNHPKQNPRRGGGLRQINSAAKSLFLQVHFLDDDILRWCPVSMTLCFTFCLFFDKHQINPLVLQVFSFLIYFFGGLECVGHSTGSQVFSKADTYQTNYWTIFKKLVSVTLLPILAVRPQRWTKDSALEGGSNWMTQLTSGMSTPLNHIQIPHW